MKFVKVKHYVEVSFEGTPSFVITLEDKGGTQKDYISNGCVFEEDTPLTRKALIKEYDCAKELEALFNSSSIETCDILNTSYMFYGCTALVSVTSDFSNSTDTSWMFSRCKSLVSVTSDFSNATDTCSMFSGCTSLVSVTSDFSNATDTRSMFYRCTALVSVTSDFSNSTATCGMFYGCAALVSVTSDFSNSTDTRYMFYGCTAFTRRSLWKRVLDEIKVWCKL